MGPDAQIVKIHREKEEKMREKVIGSYEGGNFVLRKEDGSIYLKIEPDKIFRIGNSIGGYWAKPINYAGQRMIALVRLGGSKLNWPLTKIRHVFGKEKGQILWPGLGLWAVTSGSARRGVWHRIKGDTDPIRQALREMQLPSSDLLHVVDKIDEEVYEGGGCCHHLPEFKRGSLWFLCDGEVEHLRDATFITRENCGGNQYHIGCPDQPALKRVKGGTFLIKGQDVLLSCSYRSEILDVYITKETNRSGVAEILKKIKEIGFSRTEAIMRLESKKTCA